MHHHLIGLHGFLGTPNDLSSLNLPSLIAPNIFSLPIAPFFSWARRFNSMWRDGGVLLGYSMGGRLALHCLLDDPKKYRSAIIVAAHPGLVYERDRVMRIDNDRRWGRKFLYEPWREVVDEWNSLPVLKSSKAFVREERDFSRGDLDRALNYFSLGRQDFLTPKINRLPMPILWVSPRNEADKLCGLSFKNPHSQIIFYDGGHRFIFEHPTYITRLIEQFIER